MVPPPPPVGAPGAGMGIRRKKVETEDERPEKKKTTGKRGKRAPNTVDEKQLRELHIRLRQAEPAAKS